jgi:hypothetical protein
MNNMKLEPAIIEDRRHLLASADPADLGGVRLHRHVVLVVVAPGADGELRVMRTLGIVWSPSSEWDRPKNDDTGDALRVLAAHYLKQHRMPQGGAFAVRELSR